MLRSFGALAAVGALLLSGAQNAWGQSDDTYRLGGKVGDGTTTKLAWDGQDETVLTRGYRGGFGYGGFRGGFHGGYRVGYGGFYGGHRGYYGGYRVGYGGGYRVGYGGYYGGGYGGGYYGGYAAPYASYSYYTPSYYYAAPLYYSQPCYTYPINGGITGAQTYQPMIVNPAQEKLPQPYTQPMPSADGTYPYDGGPKAPVPLPKDPTIPQYQPGLKVVPASDGRLVSLPGGQQKTATQGGFAYPAYGEQMQATTFASDRSVVTTAAAKKQQ